MPFNWPTVTTDNMTIGPCLIYLGAAGATPTAEVGAKKAEANVTIKRTFLDNYQGSPARLAKRVCVKSEIEVEFTGEEWNLQNVQRSLGGDTYSAGPPATLVGGSSLTFDELAMKIVHQTVAGGTVTMSIWKVTGSGEAKISFGPEWHTFPQKYSALNADTDWAGNSLAEATDMYKIEIQAPPA